MASTYTPANDLDFWVNMRVYLDDEADTMGMGIAQLPGQGERVDAVIVSLPRVLSMSSAKQQAFAATGKKRYVIAMGPRTTNPAGSDINTALNTLGINAIPIDVFVQQTSELLSILNYYSNMSYPIKPFALQYSS
jgi:hypothetical protein